MHKTIIALLGAGTMTVGTVHLHKQHSSHSHRPPRPHTMHVATLRTHTGRHRF
jgi:hypothetical protein